jgi:hypothetical protein
MVKVPTDVRVEHEVKLMDFTNWPDRNHARSVIVIEFDPS